MQRGDSANEGGWWGPTSTRRSHEPLLDPQRSRSAGGSAGGKPVERRFEKTARRSFKRMLNRPASRPTSSNLLLSSRDSGSMDWAGPRQEAVSRVGAPLAGDRGVPMCAIWSLPGPEVADRDFASVTWMGRHCHWRTTRPRPQASASSFNLICTLMLQRLSGVACDAASGR